MGKVKMVLMSQLLDDMGPVVCGFYVVNNKHCIVNGHCVVCGKVE